jgi:hypothetical protein
VHDVCPGRSRKIYRQQAWAIALLSDAAWYLRASRADDAGHNGISVRLPSVPQPFAVRTKRARVVESLPATTSHDL